MNTDEVNNKDVTPSNENKQVNKEPLGPTPPKDVNLPHKEKELTQVEIKKIEKIEKKKQKKAALEVLHNISKTMHVGTSWLSIFIRISLIFSLLLFLALACYAFLCFKIVEKDKNAFSKSFLTLFDPVIMKKYAPEDLKEIKMLSEKGISQDMFIRPKKVALKYVKGLKKLKNVKNKVNKRRLKYKKALRHFDSLYKEAIKKNFKRYAKNIFKLYDKNFWLKIKKLKKEAGKEENDSFNFKQAILKLNIASETLKSNRGSYKKIEQYEKAFYAFEKPLASVCSEEFIAYDLKRFTEISNAKTYALNLAKEHKWKPAIKYLKKTQINIAKTQVEIKKLREINQKALDLFASEYKKTLYQDYIVNKKKEWEKMKFLRAKAFSSHKAFLYAQSTQYFNKAFKMLKSIKSDVENLEGKARAQYKILTDAYKKAPHDILRKNSMKLWKKMNIAFRRVQILAKENKFTVLSDKSKETKKILDTLIKRVETLKAEHDIILKDFTAIYTDIVNKKMDEELLVNYSKEWGQILRLKLKAENEGKRHSYALSSGYYHDSKKILENATKKLIKIKDFSLSNFKIIQTNIAVFEPGLKRFECLSWGKIQTLFKKADLLVKEKKYVYLEDIMKELIALTPKKRFLFKKDKQLVVDYKEGQIWVSDGNSQAANKGKAINWYKAVKLVSKLNYAGYKTWRLPSEKEFKNLFDKLSEEERDTFFPNIHMDRHWTNEKSKNDSERMKTYDFIDDKRVEKIRSKFQKKKFKFFILPILDVF